MYDVRFLNKICNSLLIELLKINQLPLNQQVYEKFTEFFLSASSLFIIVHLKMCFAFKICVLKRLFLRKKNQRLLRQLYADGFSLLCYRKHIINKTLPHGAHCLKVSQPSVSFSINREGAWIEEFPLTFLLFYTLYLASSVFNCSLMFFSCHLNCLLWEILLFYQYWRLL